MPQRRRVLLIVIDAARRQETHQALDAATMLALRDAARATLIAPSCWTVPSVASILTGLFPGEHRLHWPLTEHRPDLLTVADLLERAGRSFRLISGNNLCGPPLLPLRTDQVHRPHDRWRPAVGLGRMLGGMDYGSRAILREVRQMATDGSLPDMLMLHLQEPHHPYLAPPRGLAPGARVRYAVEHLAYYLRTEAQVWQFASEADEAAWRRQRARYIECLEYAVGIVEDLLRVYDRAGGLDDTLVIITADHGEHLGEHGLADHQASLHEELVTCPCAVLAPGLEPGSAIPGQFQHTDLLLTVCSFLGIPCREYHPARAPLDMLDRANQARGHEHAFMQWRAWSEEQLAALHRRNPGYDFSGLDRDLVAVRTWRWKLIKRSDGTHALYDLGADPEEQRDLSATRADILEDLARALDQWQGTIGEEGQGLAEGAPRAERVEQQGVSKRLKDLGYV